MTVRKPLAFLLVLVLVPLLVRAALPSPPGQTVFGYADFSKQAKIEEKFLAVPDAKLAGEELKTLTSEPHLASTPADHKTAEYVAQKFQAAGLETEIVPYRVLMNQPNLVKVEAWNATGQLLMSGPEREHVEGDPYQDNPNVVMPFNGSSGSGDVTGEVVYANYGRIEDFDHLAQQHIDLHGKIVIVRYGSNFRGVKVYLAEQRGAAGVLIYSDPAGRRLLQGRRRTRTDRGARHRACSGDRCSTCSSTRAILKRPAWPRRRTCPTRSAYRPRAINRTSSPSPSAITTPSPSLKT